MSTRQKKQKLLRKLENIVNGIRKYNGKSCWLKDLQCVIGYLDRRIAGSLTDTDWAIDCAQYKKYRLIRRWYELSMDLTI